MLIAWIILLIGEIASEETVKNASSQEPLQWWQKSAIYQIYPRSFKDSDGDGVGDLNGITSKLDYFKDLGIGAIWISPIYESPMKDFGYDISNFTNIDPIFGTLEDFKKMADEFRKRDLKLIMDMVPNHSSDQHAWFKRSVDGVEPYKDYYVWKNASGTDSDGKPIPPNNWVSVFGGSAWEWNNKRQQFYLHQFVKEQPDLNFENNEVRNEVLAIVKFWLDMGVDGFRVDAVPHMYEDQEYLDEPENPTRDPASRPDEYRYWSHPYTYNLPKVLDFLADFRRLLDVYTKSDAKVRCMMVESTVPTDLIMSYYGDKDKPIAHFPFNFHLLNVKPNSTATEVLELVNIWYDKMPEGEWATFLIGNHDQLRVPTRWTEGGIDGANMINLLLQGTAVTYYGEEIGMTDTPLTWEQTVDPAGCNTDPERYQIFSRDPARTPMQWSNDTGAGFSTTKETWLPLNPNYELNNVQAQEVAEESHLKVYKELLKLRQTDAWKYGKYESQVLGDGAVLGFTRIPTRANSPGLVILVNLSDKETTVDSTVFENVPATGKLAVRSVNFQNSKATVGSPMELNAVQLGPRNSLVIEFKPLRGTQ